jgi:hypothetical protein
MTVKADIAQGLDAGERLADAAEGKIRSRVLHNVSVNQFSVLLALPDKEGTTIRDLLHA